MDQEVCGPSYFRSCYEEEISFALSEDRKILSFVFRSYYLPRKLHLKNQMIREYVLARFRRWPHFKFPIEVRLTDFNFSLVSYYFITLVWQPNSVLWPYAIEKFSFYRKELESMRFRAYSRITKGGQSVSSDSIEKYVSIGEWTILASAIFSPPPLRFWVSLRLCLSL